MEYSIKELRSQIGLTQSEVSDITGIPLRTYKNYENDPNKKGSIKYQYILQKLKDYAFIDETHGILNHDDIVTKVSEVFSDYDVDYCYLFGSYAKGKATETSDVDLLISSTVSGLKYYGLADRLRTTLKKKVDLLDLNQLNNNPELLNEILKYGEKIYDKER